MSEKVSEAVNNYHEAKKVHEDKQAARKFL